MNTETKAGKASLEPAQRIGVDDFSAALTRGVLRAIDERKAPEFNRRIWVGIWIDWGPNGPIGGLPGQDQIGGGIR